MENYYNEHQKLRTEDETNTFLGKSLYEEITEVEPNFLSKIDKEKDVKNFEGIICVVDPNNNKYYCNEIENQFSKHRGIVFAESNSVNIKFDGQFRFVAKYVNVVEKMDINTKFCYKTLPLIPHQIVKLSIWEIQY